jgi:iron complex transport system substrate-binding protein
MKQHPLVLVILLAALCGSTAIVLAVWRQPQSRDVPDTRMRIVSVMPPITETLFEIGAGEYVVGRSDWCEFPPPVRDLPSCGSARTPNVEAIARLEPTLIVGDDSVATAHEKLSGLGHAEFIPWLTAEEMLAGTRRLGRLTGCEEAANRLADELEPVLLAKEPADGPRVLLAMAHSPGQLQTVTFMRRNSMHGRVLYAAGGRNAADFDVTGVPNMSIEKAIELDPDMIILIAVAGDVTPDTREAILADWQRITPLRAVREGRIGLLHGKNMVPAARRTFRLAEALREEIERLGR